MSDYQYQGTNPDAEVTEKQVNFANTLASERNLNLEDVTMEVHGVDDFSSLTRAEASQVIDHLKKQPRPGRS